jgi:hypothetical protein
MQAIAHHAELEGYQQVAQLQAPNGSTPRWHPICQSPRRGLSGVTAPPQRQRPRSPGRNHCTWTSSHAVTPTSEPTADPTAYLQNFLEYPGLLFGGMGAGKSWTARYLVMEKVRAGHQVILLDPHAANHEWKGHPAYRCGMDYPRSPSSAVVSRRNRAPVSGVQPLWLNRGRLAAVVTAAAAHYQRGVGRNDELGRPTAG